MNDNKFELFNCPFCGTLAFLIEGFAGWYAVCPNKNDKHVVEMGPYTTKKLAIKAWNKRA